MKSILLFEDVYGLFGGIEKVINNIIENADPEEFSFSLCVNHMASDEYLPFLKEHHVKIFELENYWEKNPIKRHLAGYKAFRVFLKSHSFDIIHFHISNSIDLKYIAIAKKAGFPIRIAHCHNDEATSSAKRIMHKFLKPFNVKKATYNVACSDKAGRWLYTKKIMKSDSYKTIPNGIPTCRFAFSAENRELLRKEFGASDKTLMVMHVGRFNKQKNQAKAISAFEIVHKEKPDSKLVFFGAGDKTSLRNFVLEQGLSDSVIFHPPVTNVNEYYSAFDCFVFPSLYEGFGIVVVEAETNGLHCVLADTIPSFVVFGTSVSTLPLLASDTEWAKEILSSPIGNRKDNVSLAQEKGFDQKEQAKAIYCIYREELARIGRK
jgi:glycosyltransferase involved in cell wall biosynthesis